MFYGICDLFSNKVSQKEIKKTQNAAKQTTRLP